MSLLALVSIAALCCAPQAGVADPVEVEFRIRDLAMGAPVEALDSWDWRDRYRAMEALARREPSRISASEIEFVRAGTSDAHPNVRGAALAVHARHALPLLENAGGLAQDPMPEVRLQLARALGSTGTQLAGSLLAVLCLDVDMEVARTARAQLFSRGRAAHSEQLAFLQDQWDEMSPSDCLHLLDVLDRSNGTEQLIKQLSLWLKGRAAPEEGLADFRIKRALWFSLQGAPVDEQAVRWIADAWLREFPNSASRTESRRRRRLDRIQLNEPHRADLVRLLLDSAGEQDRLAGLAGDQAFEARALSNRAVVGAVSVHFAWGAGEAPRAFPMDPSWSPELEEEVWDACFGWAESWGESADRMLASPSPDVRSAAWSTLSETWRRTGKVPERAWLQRALSDEELATNVYRDLLHSKRELQDMDLLHAWWSAQKPATRLELLREHWTGRAYLPWRRDLLDLWVLQSKEQRTVLQLMAGFEGDEDLAERFLEGLNEELEQLERSPVPDEEVIRGAWREAESRARWQLEALLKIRGEGHVVERSRLLLRVGQLGKELGKILIADLVSSPEGRIALDEAFLRPELSKRMRYEILLLHPGLTDPDRIGELYLAYPTCDEELQLRILERAARGKNDLARALLLDVAGDPRQGTALRFQAVTSLVELGRRHTEVIGPLLGMLDATEDFEFQQVLVRGLGELAHDHRPLRLLERHGDEFEHSMIGDDLLAAMVRIELRGKGTGSDAPALSPELLSRWQGQPAGLAVSELRARFDGSGLSSRNFAYSGWLDAADAMDRAGVLEASLGERWWTWDGRLLMRLAELVAEGHGPSKQAFVQSLRQAACSALEGEGPSSDRAGLLLRLGGLLFTLDMGEQRWQRALLRVTGMLDDWRAGRVLDSTVERTFGPSDPANGRDPRIVLLAVELECQVRLALAQGNSELVRALRPRLKLLSKAGSIMACERLRKLDQELGE